jgi:hypothetical protein
MYFMECVRLLLYKPSTKFRGPNLSMKWFFKFLLKDVTQSPDGKSVKMWYTIGRMIKNFKIFHVSLLPVSCVSNQFLRTLSGTILEPTGDVKLKIPNFERIALLTLINQLPHHVYFTTLNTLHRSYIFF